MVMCPHCKLQWFVEHGHSPDKIEELRQLVITRFDESYSGLFNTPAGHMPPLVSSTPTEPWAPRKRSSKWLQPLPSISSTSEFSVDDIRTYLNDPPITHTALEEVGGLKRYWHQASLLHPRISKMGSDCCSAPASSVDAERAFSRGRLQVNHMQHCMKSQTFKAQMAVGSWALTPLYLGLESVTKIIEMQEGKDDPGEAYLEVEVM
ncbi:hypothetical protein HWV62_45470 [Athelia sp. TMB]|nr:hypothetical protein HWV62_45470 [Athelia sp. TMB]